MTHEEREQALSEEDYIELRNRFGTVVENVVRDMVSGKGERWEQAQADGEYISKEKAIIQLSWDLSEVELPRIKESLDKLPSVAISPKNTETQGDDRWLLHFGQNMAIPSAEPKTGWHIAHGMYEDRFWCSCGYIKIIDNNMSEWKYCPVCGAKMD